MSKTKTPFLSLGASGTIADALTSQKGSSSSILRSKPTPTDRRTLPQIYQRWLYEDYAYLWRQQSQATQAEYRAAGVRFHLTGFQYWMKYQLTNLPDIILWHKLDEPAGAIAHDSGRTLNNGTIIGASPVVGPIDRARYFDGINDLITLPTPINSPTGIWTYFELFTTYTGFAADLATIMDYHGGNAQSLDGGFSIVFYLGKIRPTIEGIGTVQVIEWPCPWGDNETHSISVTYDGTTYRLHTDGVFRGQVVFAWAPALFNMSIGRRTDGWGPSKGTLDNILYFNRVLDTPELLRWTARRYPP